MNVTRPDPSFPGAVEVDRLMRRHGGREMARKLGCCTEATIRHIAAGRSTPRARLRERLREVYAVPPECFEAAASRPRPKAMTGHDAPARSGEAPGRGAARRLISVATASDDPRAMALALVRGTELDIAAARNAGATARELGQLRASLNTSVRMFARCSGAFEITETQIIRSLPWQRLVALVREVLTKHPDAARDLQQALLALEAQ